MICIFFEVQSSAFFTATNIVNLFVQAAFIILLGMAELYALLLSEIDLSVGFVGAVGAAIALAFIGSPQNWPWWAGLIVGLAACAVIGAFQGTIITRLKIPSFVVTLAGLLGWQGVLIYVFDVDKGAVGGVISISNGVIDDLVSGNMTPAAGWIVLVAVRGALRAPLDPRNGTPAGAGPERAATEHHDPHDRGAVAVAGIVLVCVCNLNRGSLTPGRGRALGHPVRRDHARRAVVPVGPHTTRPLHVRHRGQSRGGTPGRDQGLAGTHHRLRLVQFTAGLAVVVYASRLGSISVGFDGGTYVLYAVAAAVIGGASLFGGHGKPIHPLLGGLVIATLTNGLALLNISTAGTDVATAVVLLVAVAVDSTLRRRGRMGTA